LWNLVAEETREGDVYARLLRKIESQREALGDGIFDILGKLFHETSLRQLLLEAIRYGDQPEVRARLFQAVDNLADQEHVRELLEDRSLARDSMDVTNVQRIREDFERAQARRLQPHFIESFFKAAFEHLEGTLHAREPLRFEISHVPAVIRNRGRMLSGTVLQRYERITFHKEAINPPGKVVAEFVCPGNPLMDSVTDLILERYRGLLRQGAVLVDPNDPGEDIRALFYLEHSIQDARTQAGEDRRVISRQMQFVEINARGETRAAGPAPFLDYQPLTDEMRGLVEPSLQSEWLRGDLESQVRAHAIQVLVPEHLGEVKARREDMIERTRAAVQDRLTKEIAYWDHRAEELKAQERAGKKNARLNSDLARRRADDLQSRLQRRMEELEQERHIAAQPPLVLGGALIIPNGLLMRLQGQALSPEAALFARQHKAVEMAAMQAAMAKERELGYEPVDVSDKNLGWDIESCIPGTGKLRFIEVKGRIVGATTITVTKNEILAGLNKPEDYFLAVVEVVFEEEKATGKNVFHIPKPFKREPDFAATSVNYELKQLFNQ
jgi:hypothetical protein